GLSLLRLLPALAGGRGAERHHRYGRPALDQHRLHAVTAVRGHEGRAGSGPGALFSRRALSRIAPTYASGPPLVAGDRASPAGHASAGSGDWRHATDVGLCDLLPGGSALVEIRYRPGKWRRSHTLGLESASRLPETQSARVPRPFDRSARRRLPHHAIQDRPWVGRYLRQGISRRYSKPPQLPAG